MAMVFEDREAARRQTWRFSDFALFSVLLLLGVLLRANNITATSIWLDEAVSISQSSGTLADLISKTAGDNYPPLHNLLLFLSFHLLGNTELAARLPSVILSSLDLPLAYAFAASAGLRKAGLIAVAILATSAFHLWYAQEARMYALLSFVSIAFALTSLRFLQSPSWWRSAGVLLSGVALAYSHPFGLINEAAIGLGTVATGLLQVRRPGRTAAYIGLGACVLASYAPWALIIVARAQSIAAGGFWIPIPDLPYLEGEGLNLLSGEAGAVIVVVGAVLLVLTSLTMRQSAHDEGARPPNPAIILCCWAVLPFLAALAASYILQPVVLARYLIGSLPALALLAGWGYGRLLPTNGALAIALAAVVGFGFYGIAGYHARREDWRSATAYLNSAVDRSRDCVIIYPDFARDPLLYYYKTPPSCFVEQAINDANIPPQTAGRKTFLVSFLATGIGDTVRSKFEAQGYVAADDRDFNGVRVEAFQDNMKSPPAPALPAATSIDLQVWGQGYGSAPQLAVIADGRVIGRATVTATTFDTAQTFKFALLDNSNPQRIEIALTNDNYAGPGKDTNLYVRSVFVHQQPINLDQLAVDDARFLSHIDKHSIVIGTDDAHLVVKRPQSGW